MKLFSRMRTFWKSTRAGASLVAAGVTVMTAMAAGLIIDHAWMVGNRDRLKSASDSAAVAATLQLQSFSEDVADSTVLQELQKTAERYVALNLSHRLSSEKLGQLVVTVEMERSTGTVSVHAEAPLGNTLLGSVHGYLGLESIHANSGADYNWTPVWAILALDTSRTMSNALDGRSAQSTEDQRMHIVREAAKEFVDAVGPTPDIPIAVGVVPWSWSVGSVLTPSTAPPSIDAALDRLRPVGSATASSRGLRRSRELLATAPVGTRKVIVLLTDGEDNRSVTGGSCGPRGRADCPRFREAECDGAKAEGVDVFVIGAMENTSGALATQLRECASSEGHAFINHEDTESMRETFRTISGTLMSLQRTS